METSTSGSKSLKDYLKRYETNAEEENKKKRKKKKPKLQGTGLLVVDEDPAWQKPIDLGAEENDEPSDEERPQIDEDIEVKRMRRLEQRRSRYNSISEDGSGWVLLSSQPSNSNDISPPRKLKVRNDTPSPEPARHPRNSDLSPPRKQFNRYDTPSPVDDGQPPVSTQPYLDLSPPRKRKAQSSLLSPSDANRRPSEKRNEAVDLSPPRQRRKHYYSSSPEPDANHDLSAPANSDIPPPRRSHHPIRVEHTRRNYEKPHLPSISPQRVCNESPGEHKLDTTLDSDISPPKKSQKNAARQGLHDSSLYPQRSLSGDTSRASLPADFSPPRKRQKEISAASTKNQMKTGLISGQEIREEIDKVKNEDLIRFGRMDPSISGRGAEPIYRDKMKGERISKDEYLKSQKKVEEKPKEIKLEWGKGLAQKREAEARIQELELEKDKPFARTRDDPELDKMMKERLRWGDPMAHLVKKKLPDPVLPDFGDSEKMKESGFVIPQDIPSHSWLKRGLDAAPNRYGIKPGRHWDGVDRSNGYENDSFKRMNQKQATEREAYLWSVSDM